MNYNGNEIISATYVTGLPAARESAAAHKAFLCQGEPGSREIDRHANSSEPFRWCRRDAGLFPVPGVRRTLPSRPAIRSTAVPHHLNAAGRSAPGELPGLRQNGDGDSLRQSGWSAPEPGVSWTDWPTGWIRARLATRLGVGGKRGRHRSGTYRRCLRHPDALPEYEPGCRPIHGLRRHLGRRPAGLASSPARAAFPNATAWIR
jgi:hypothetical protein